MYVPQPRLLTLLDVFSHNVSFTFTTKLNFLLFTWSLPVRSFSINFCCWIPFYTLKVRFHSPSQTNLLTNRATRFLQGPLTKHRLSCAQDCLWTCSSPKMGLKNPYSLSYCFLIISHWLPRSLSFNQIWHEQKGFPELCSLTFIWKNILLFMPVILLFV